MNLARIYLELGDSKQSVQHAQQCIESFKGQVPLEFAIQLAFIYSKLESFEKADKYIQSSQQMLISNPGAFNQANLEYVKGEYFLAKRLWHEADLAFNEALGLADSGKFHELSLTVILRLAEVNIHLAVDQGEDEKITDIHIHKALRFLEDGTILAQEYGFVPVYINLYLIRSLLETNRGRWNEGEKFLKDAEDLARENNLHAIYAGRITEQRHAQLQVNKQVKKKSGFFG